MKWLREEFNPVYLLISIIGFPILWWMFSWWLALILVTVPPVAEMGFYYAQEWYRSWRRRRRIKLHR